MFENNDQERLASTKCNYCGDILHPGIVCLDEQEHFDNWKNMHKQKEELQISNACKECGKELIAEDNKDICVYCAEKSMAIFYCEECYRKKNKSTARDPSTKEKKQ